MNEINQRPGSIALQNIQLENGFWGERQRTNRNRTIPAIYHQMQITGRLDAWRLNWKPGEPLPHFFWDSDAGKWIEAVSYSLRTEASPDFEQQIDSAVDLIEQAQQSDGYLNIYFTSVEPENRWRNLRDRHELYCAGHLIEGAVAYFQATGKRKLLDVMLRYVDHIDARFGRSDGQIHGYDGHPEIELALIKLYHVTGDQRHLDLARYFIDERGQQPHFFDLEATERGDNPADFWAKSYHYCQAHAPIREQTTATGHAVRAAYLFSGVADLVAETGDTSLLEVSRAVWDDITHHAMYITGGLGPAHANEGFTFPYDLPNESAYAETCASVALVFLAKRMFQIDPHSRYTDVIERALYNGVISGVSYEGSHFFYANPLASYPHINPYEHWSGIQTERHYRRSEWFECACCPPNLARLVASLGSYFYSSTADTIFVHLYNQCQAQFQIKDTQVQIKQQTAYPWDSRIDLEIQVSQPVDIELALRIPGWCRDFQLEINGTAHADDPVDGYARIKRQWTSGDVITLSLHMPVERMAAHPSVRQTAGNIALQRGPVVYCLEEVDNGAHLANVIIPRNANLHATMDTTLFGGISVIHGDAVRLEPTAWHDGLYQSQSTTTYTQLPFQLQAIPYCFWANRDPGEMRVWLREA